MYSVQRLTGVAYENDRADSSQKWTDEASATYLVLSDFPKCVGSVLDDKEFGENHFPELRNLEPQAASWPY